MTIQPIFIDVYVDDLNGAPNWTAAAQDTQVAGAILKATQGLEYSYPTWLATNWKAIHSVDRTIGTDWFCGAYHYLDPFADGDAQAAFFVQNLDAAGGLAANDLWPIVDVELGACSTVPSASQVTNAVSEFVAGIRSRLGRSTMLYGGEAMRQLNITSTMGCNLLWTARYAPTLPEPEITEIGWTEATLWGWQYQGTGPGNVGTLAGYPTAIPNFANADPSDPTVGVVDLTVMVMAGGLPALSAALTAAP